MKIKKSIEIEFEVFEDEKKALDEIKSVSKISKDLTEHGKGYEEIRGFISWLYKHSFALAKRQ